MNWEQHYETTSLEGTLGDFSEPVLLVKVDETRHEAFWDHLVNKYHYLGFDSTIGCRVKYLIAMGKRLVGAISFCSAAYKLGPRDQYIGWDEKTRLEFLPHLINNNRFLIFPWVKVRNLASHTLALSLRQVREDWIKQYEVEPYMAETFVDPDKYIGTSYIAAGWTYLGTTKGFGKIGNSFVYHGQKKDIYVSLMNRRFAKLFRPDTDRLPNEREELLKMLNGIPIHREGILKMIGLPKFNRAEFDSLLADHLAPYMQFLSRSELIPLFTTVVLGRMSDLERKTNRRIAANYTNCGEVRKLNNLMTRARIDDQGMLDAYQADINTFLSHPEGMITGDGCDFPKKGNNSVGVSRQYCGCLGKVETCQASVMMGYAGPKGYGLIDYELYMPEKWFEDDYADLREKCKVPEGLTFNTKNQLLSDMITKAVNEGMFKGKYVGVDCSFGRDHVFLDSIPKGLVYFADVPCSHQVFYGRPELVTPKYKGIGRKPYQTTSFSPLTVEEIASDSRNHWQKVALDNGSKGIINAEDKCIKVTEIRDGKPGSDIWLYVRRMPDKHIKYSLCNESMDASRCALRIPALMRWSIEQCFRECKTDLGMDQYESRTWPAWRRHILFTFIAHLFINKLRRKFSLKMENVDMHGPAPFVSRPVKLKDYEHAVTQIVTDSPIEHPDITAAPVKPQQILTVGLIKKLIQQFIPKTGKMLEVIDNDLAEYQAAFHSHTYAKIKALFGIELVLT